MSKRNLHQLRDNDNSHHHWNNNNKRKDTNHHDHHHNNDIDDAELEKKRIDRNERTIMISRIPKIIKNEDDIYQIIYNAMQISLLKDKNNDQQQQQHSNDNDTIITIDLENLHHDTTDSSSSCGQQQLIEQVTLVYPVQEVVDDNDMKRTTSTTSTNQNQNNNNNDRFHDRPYKKKKNNLESLKVEHEILQEKGHCGYGFVRFVNIKDANYMKLYINTIRIDKNQYKNTGTITTTTSTTTNTNKDKCVEKDDALITFVEPSNKTNNNKKKKYHTIYIGSCIPNENLNIIESEQQEQHEQNRGINNQNKFICFLWTNHRCPYGTQCKFQHIGPGSCSNTVVVESTTSNNSNMNNEITKSKEYYRKKIKCFNYRKGKCKFNESTCPYSHNFDNTNMIINKKKEQNKLPKETKEKKKKKKKQQKQNDV